MNDDDQGVDHQNGSRDFDSGGIKAPAVAVLEDWEGYFGPLSIYKALTGFFERPKELEVFVILIDGISLVVERVILAGIERLRSCAIENRVTTGSSVERALRAPSSSASRHVLREFQPDRCQTVGYRSRQHQTKAKTRISWVRARDV